MATSSSRVTRGGLAAEDTLLRLADYFTGGNGETAITKTTVGADTGIDVNVIGGSITASFGANFDYGASSTALRTAAQIGNATGAALFGAGTTTAQVLRVVLPTDQTAIPVTDNGGSITVDGTVTANLGTIAGVATEVTLAALNAKFNTLGQKTMANSAPVVIASDQTVIPVSDNGGSLTVDGTVAVTQSTSPWVVSAASLPLPTGAATLAEQQTQTTALQLIDNIVISQNASLGANQGVMAMGSVSNAAPTYTDGRINALSLNTAGDLRTYDEQNFIQNVLNAGTLSSIDSQLFSISSYTSNLNTMTTAFVLNDAFATGRGVPAMGEYDDTSTTLPSADDRVFMARITQNRAWHNYAVNAAGLAIHVAQGSTTSGQYGNLAMGAVTTSSPSYTTAQTSPLSITTNGLLRVSPTGIFGNPNFYAPVGSFDIPANFEADPIAGTVAGVNLVGGRLVAGCLAHDAADSASDAPIKIGSLSTSLTSEQAAVSAAGDRVHFYTDTKGYQHTKTNAHRSAVTQIFNAQVFNNTTTTANSSTFDCTRYRYLVVYVALTESGSATDIRLRAQFDRGSSNFHDWYVNQWTDLRWVTGQMPVNEIIPVDQVCGVTFRIRADATGTTAINTITLSCWVEGIT